MKYVVIFPPKTKAPDVWVTSYEGGKKLADSFMKGLKNSGLSKYMGECKILSEEEYAAMGNSVPTEEKSILTSKELTTIKSISDDPEFIKAMEKLKTEDIIEYETKMSQFRAQVEGQKSAQAQAKDVVKCPKCGSTNITTGARGVNGFWGFVGASKTTNRCASCGHQWQPRR